MRLEIRPSQVLVGILGIVALLIALFAPRPAGQPAFTGDARGRVIGVAGVGTVKIKPDTAELRLGLERRAQTAQEAAAAADKAMAAVIEALKKAGVAAEQIRTTGYSVYPEQRWDTDKGVPELVGYRADNSIEVTTPQLAEVGRLMDTALAAGVTQVEGVRFLTKNLDEDKQKAIQLAVADARRRADAAAAAAGVRVRRVVSITVTAVEGGGGVQPVELYLQKAAGAPVGGMGGGAPIMTGESELRVVVQVEYGF